MYFSGIKSFMKLLSLHVLCLYMTTCLYAHTYIPTQTRIYICVCVCVCLYWRLPSRGLQLWIPNWRGAQEKQKPGEQIVFSPPNPPMVYPQRQGNNMRTDPPRAETEQYWRSIWEKEAVTPMLSGQWIEEPSTLLEQEPVHHYNGRHPRKCQAWGVWQHQALTWSTPTG